MITACPHELIIIDFDIYLDGPFWAGQAEYLRISFIIGLLSWHDRK